MSQINHVKRQYPSSKQKCRLVQLLKNDIELRSGRFSATLTMQVAAGRWNAIAEELNAIPGAKKSGMGWRKTWIDMKSNSKKKFYAKKIKKQSADDEPLLESVADRLETCPTRTAPVFSLQSSCDYEDPLLNGKETDGFAKVKIENVCDPIKAAECRSPEPVQEFVTYNTIDENTTNTEDGIKLHIIDHSEVDSPVSPSPSLFEMEKILQDVEQSRMRMEQQMLDTNQQMVAVLSRFADAAEALSGTGTRLANVLESVGHALIAYLNKN